MTTQLTLADIRVMMGQSGHSRPASCEYVRDLVEADKDFISTHATGTSQIPAIKALRAQHHNLAKMIASGVRPRDAAFAGGFTPATVARYQQDPAFQDLVEHYKSSAEVEYLDAHAKLAALGTAVVEELTDRLLSGEEKFSPAQLIRMGEFALDRSIAPPKTRGGNLGGNAPAVTISFHGAAPGGSLLSQEVTVSVSDAIDGEVEEINDDP